MKEIKIVTVESCTDCPGCHRDPKKGLYCFFAQSTDKTDVLELEEDMIAEDVPTQCPLFDNPVQMKLADFYTKEAE